jgi:hypothetical protein
MENAAVDAAEEEPVQLGYAGEAIPETTRVRCTVIFMASGCYAHLNFSESTRAKHHVTATRILRNNAPLQAMEHNMKQNTRSN